MFKNISAYERTLVLLKPDAVQRGLIGEIISRFENKGLKISAMKMVWPTEEIATKHYDQPESAMMALGEKTLASYREKGIELNESPMDIARRVQKTLVKFMTTGPVVAMVVEGAHAVAHVRKIRGGTNPLSADMGTITGDYTIDSYFLADEGQRAVRNLAHASGTKEEAEHEIKIWFTEDEIYHYQTAIDKVLYSIEWEQADQESLRGSEIA
jgi:nucleoside-diphosphate kinase